MAVTNKVPHSTDNSAWQGDSPFGGDYWYLELNAEKGYKFDGDITATYNDTSGQPQTLVLTPRNAYNVQVWVKACDTDANTAFEITGNTIPDNELDVTNEIPNTTATGEKLGTWQARITVTANEGYKITAAQVEFTGSNGFPDTQDLTISPDGTTASWEYDGANTDDSFTLTGGIIMVTLKGTEN